ncbi:MAG: MarR family transcriptional regulator [Devosia sp.]|jgi:DNA-binding MarR family transcriptional regulator|uniref:MarR family winged helix-turn-helix transcriptional regulator n=1 Tax=Devosia sp. TaxID=1871048 RepID=UPI001A4731FA|nr:MarR family transcriptional regulator [Devosia sp.]MBL8600107.1 MarR family transcriptional regulator [Devosia sp.]
MSDDIAKQIKLDVLICFAAYSASHAFSRFYRPLLDKLGLTYPQFIVMMVLWEKGQTTMKALTEELLLDSNTLTPLLKKLEAAGLVQRSRNRDDERVLDVAATDKGMALKLEGQRASLALAEATGETLEGVLELQQRLTRMREHVEKSLAA